MCIPFGWCPRRSAKALALGCAVAIALACLPERSAGQAPARPSDGLARALLLYHGNDTTDAAKRAFEAVIRAPRNRAEAQAAQFYLGSYHHRKYYILRERTGKEERPALEEAEEAFRDYVERYGSQPSQWLSDARFFKALVLLERRDRKRALRRLDEMLRDARYDPQIYVDKIVWSSNPGDVIDDRFDAREIGEYARSVINRNPRITCDELVKALKVWCLGQRMRQSKTRA